MISGVKKWNGTKSDEKGGESSLAALDWESPAEMGTSELWPEWLPFEDLREKSMSQCKGRESSRYQLPKPDRPWWGIRVYSSHSGRRWKVVSGGIVAVVKMTGCWLLAAAGDEAVRGRGGRWVRRRPRLEVLPMLGSSSPPPLDALEWVAGVRKLQRLLCDEWKGNDWDRVEEISFLRSKWSSIWPKYVNLFWGK